MYEMLLKFEPKITELTAFYDLSLNTTDHFKKQNFEWLQSYEWRDLLLLNAVYHLGETGKGYYFKSENEEKEEKLIELRIIETPDELLKRYANLLIFKSKKELIRRISTNLHSKTSVFLINGLDVLKQAYEKNGNLSGANTLEEKFLIEYVNDYKFEKNELIRFYRSESDWGYFYCPEKLLQKIRWLYDKFVAYITGVKGVYPYRKFEQVIHNNKIVFEGYVYIYNCVDFMDWINTYVFEEKLIQVMSDRYDIAEAILIEV